MFFKYWYIGICNYFQAKLKIFSLKWLKCFCDQIQIPSEQGSHISTSFLCLTCSRSLLFYSSKFFCIKINTKVNETNRKGHWNSSWKNCNSYCNGFLKYMFCNTSQYSQLTALFCNWFNSHYKTNVNRLYVPRNDIPSSSKHWQISVR